MVSNASRKRRVTLLASAVMAVTACGGGGGDSGNPAAPSLPPPAPAPTSVSGTVLVASTSVASVPTAAPANITVCFDANINRICDGDEASTSADASGAYTLTGLPTTQAPGAPLLAVVTTPGRAPYTLQSPTVRAAIISPITTLVQTGVSQGLSLDASEAATSRQLQINRAALYQNYLTTPGSASDALLIADWAIVDGLRESMTLSVGSVNPAPSDTVLARMTYTSAQTYDARFYHYTNTFDAQSGIAELYLLPAGRANGGPRSHTSMFINTWADTPQGWVRTMPEASLNFTGPGNPYVTLWSNGVRNVSTEIEGDVSGQSIASVVQLLQDPTIAPPVMTGMPTMLAGTMPSGSKVRRVKWKARYTDSFGLAGRISGATTIADAITTYPIPSTPAQATTLSLGSLSLLPSCVNGICAGYNLRAAFNEPARLVHFYRCDSDMSFTTVMNCVAIGSSDYTIGTSSDGVTPRMRFTPPGGSGSNTRGLVAHNGQVYVVTGGPNNFGSGTAVRLNRVGFNALASALGIDMAPPAPLAHSPYMGLWMTNYSGAESGSCPWVLVDALGRLGGSCTSTMARSFVLSGSISDLGNFSSTGSADVFGGTFLATGASGTWSQPATGATGTWNAIKY